jgi:ABC-type dipeptide/oligopeptide/nickel transport system ATPase component
VVAFLCDRLAVMRHGEVVEVAEVASLLQGLFVHTYSRELYEASGGAGAGRAVV